MNVKGGRCECCQGNGTLKIELNYLPESYVTCPECKGRRFKPEILTIKYHDKNIHELLSAQIQDIIEDFKDEWREVMSIYQFVIKGDERR